MDYELFQKGKPGKGSVISKKSLAAFIIKVIELPETYVRIKIGINKPEVYIKENGRWKMGLRTSQHC